MSSTLQQHVAATSFFPTTKELASGIQWFKEHPVLAAAAAATVSVITYWSTAATMTTPEAEAEAEETKRSKDTKLCAAVSWCDEHGGSLTQVFEEAIVCQEEEEEDNDKEETTTVSTVEEEQPLKLTRKPPLNPRTKDDMSHIESPQWGWYVAITPPQDHVHPHVLRTHVPQTHSTNKSGGLRRSTSGRIP